MGGIGTVLEGLINSRPYQQRVDRTVLVCPMFDLDASERLGPGGEPVYSSLDHLWRGPYTDDFRRVEADYNVHIAYGRRTIEDAITGRRASCEVLLIDVRNVREQRVSALKARLWELHGLQSQRHEHVWDFEQYMRLAAPAQAALNAMGLGDERDPAIVLAHEFMGVPTGLALLAEQPHRWRAIFHAHEVATVRRIVEEHPGHDTMFYNVLQQARAGGLYLPDVFGSQHDYFKHALVETTHDFDAILAVGHHVVDELRFLGSAFDQSDIALAYNGVPLQSTGMEEFNASRALVMQYCRRLLGWEPDRIFTHVTRLARSKALWRDLDVLESLDAHLVERNERAVFLVLATELPRRPTADVLHMESAWDWPLAHGETQPDLTGGEANYYRRLQAFNVKARNIRAIYLNQFGFENPVCGLRMPEEMHFSDLRRAADAEFGLSLYEPFGISPLEPLTFGGLCVVSTSCGCAGFVRDVTGGKPPRNVILADYLGGKRRPANIGDALLLGEEDRRRVEREAAVQIAAELAKRLPPDEKARAKLMKDGHELAARMSWDVVAERHIFPTMERVSARRQSLKVV
jgi:hypothetical protein